MKTEDKGIRTYGPVPYRPKGTGPDSAGQSGDTQGIDDPEEEALLEGPVYEAEVMERLRHRMRIRRTEAPAASEHDVPGEYQEEKD